MFQPGHLNLQAASPRAQFEIVLSSFHVLKFCGVSVCVCTCKEAVCSSKAACALARWLLLVAMLGADQKAQELRWKMRGEKRI